MHQAMIHPGSSSDFTIVVLCERIGPYHFARLSALASLVHTVVIELFGMDAVNGWDKVTESGGFRRITLFEKNTQEPTLRRQLAERIPEVLTKLAPSVVAINGWSDKAALAALKWCLRTGTPSVVMSASSAIGKRRPWRTEVVKRRVVRNFSAGLGGGTPHVDYLTGLGIPRERIFPGCDVVDNDYFGSQTVAARSNAVLLRARHGLPVNYFLTIARFVPEKNLHRLLHAYAAYRKSAGAKAWEFVLLGDGELKPELLRLREDLRLEDHLFLPGYKQYAEIPPFYALAGAFVLPSMSETWGLVVNEAMSSGLPVIVSKNCGCHRDLVAHGRNGFIFDPHNTEDLANALLRISTEKDLRFSMGEASRAIIAHWTPKMFATNLHCAAQAAAAAPTRRTSFADRLLLNALINTRQ